MKKQKPKPEPSLRSKVLLRAAEIISKPERWAKGAFAKDRWGTARATYESQVVSFCATGACRKAEREYDAPPCLGENYVQEVNYHKVSLIAVNDASMSHRTPLQLLDAAAIESLREDGIEPEDVLT